MVTDRYSMWLAPGSCERAGPGKAGTRRGTRSGLLQRRFADLAERRGRRERLWVEHDLDDGRTVVGVGPGECGREVRSPLHPLGEGAVGRGEGGEVGVSRPEVRA